MGCDWNALGQCECAGGRKCAFWGQYLLPLTKASGALGGLQPWFQELKCLGTLIQVGRLFLPSWELPNSSGGNDLMGWINNLQDSSPKFSAPPTLIVVGKGCQLGRFSLGIWTSAEAAGPPLPLLCQPAAVSQAGLRSCNVSQQQRSWGWR